MGWTEEMFQHLLWYVTTEPTPQGYLERECGPEFSPCALYVPREKEVPSTGNVVSLSLLINYLEEEVTHKDLRARAEAFKAGSDEVGLLRGHGLQGQEALDTYISELVARIRDFPYDKLQGGKEAGAWVRDDVVAPRFRGLWSFYTNKKLQCHDVDLAALEHLLCGENMLLDSLRYVQHATQL